ncbi:MAG: DUF2865 domain-containing protein [Rhodoplanes sp.]
MRAGYRRLSAAILLASTLSGGALAQAPVNPVCGRLEGQLALINRGGDPGQQDQARRYEEAINRQQADLDGLIARWRRLGCESVGIFSLFSSQPAECRPIGGQIQDMRASISQRQAELQRLQGGDLESQRQTVIAALAQNNCGPQYQAAANQQRGFFASLFGSNPILPAPDGYLSSTYRTLCVRTCDGYYFPISFQVSASHFTDDEQTCQRLCPATEVALYTHRNPGEEIGQAVSLAGRPYRSLPTAFRYRQALDSACTCRKPGQSWAEALGGGYDTTIQRGDVVVTEESSKAMAQPRNDAQGRPIPSAGGASTAPPQAAPSGSGSGDSELLPAPVRTVGPPFVPAK